MKQETDYIRVVRTFDGMVRSALDTQVLEHSREDYGGFFSSNMGFASPSHVGNAINLMQLGMCYLCPDSCFHADEKILKRILLSIEFQKRCQRPSGFIDIPSCNFDSPPDTGFAVQLLAALSSLAIMLSDVPGAQEIEEALKPYLISSAEALTTGGFHTPNHRWVMVSAMAQVRRLYPNEELDSAIEAYLAEGIDINEDGEYSERSSGGYNAVVNRSLILAAESLERWELLEPVRGNLNTMLDLMNDDWTIVTSISRRQDKGRKRVPTVATDSFYYLSRKEDDARISGGARALFDRGGQSNPWLLYWFLRKPEWQADSLKEGKVCTDFSRYMKHSGVLRVRRGKMSSTLATETDARFSVKYGNVELVETYLHCPYFAGAKYFGDSLELQDGVATMRLKSEHYLPQLPGYWMPVGAPVEFQELPFNNLERRQLRPRPEMYIILTIKEVDDGFDLSILTEDGLPRVPFEAAFIFSTPGEIETENLSAAAASKQTVFLKDGYLTYRVKDDAITIGPGFYGHRIITDGQDGCFSVVMTDWTPVERNLKIRCGTWSEAKGQCFSKKGPSAGFSVAAR